MTTQMPEPVRQRSLRRWFDDFPTLRFPFARPWAELFGEAGEEAWAPAVDVVGKEGAIVVKADLPGVKKEDVSAEVQDGNLVIRAERKREAEKTGEGYQRKERFFGRFERVLMLPEGADEAASTATYKDGVLEITIPVKKQEPQPETKKIAIG